MIQTKTTVVYCYSKFRNRLREYTYELQTKTQGIINYKRKITETLKCNNKQTPTYIETNYLITTVKFQL